MYSAENSSSTNHLNWNIQSGGFASYDYTLEQPVRGPLIQSVLNDAKQEHDITSATLVDAHRWDDVYGESGIATFTNFAETNIIDLVAQNRKALGVVLDIGDYGLYIANVYIDDLDEDVRMTQVNALIDQLPDMPVVISGDINALPENASGASILHKLASLAVRGLALIPSSNEIIKTTRQMNRRQVIPLAKARGFTSADHAKQPTAPSKLPLYTIDHILHNDQVTASSVRIIRSTNARQASDHLPGVSTLQAA